MLKIDRGELAGFLRSRRERLRPEDIGLPGNSRRRTAGLRREDDRLVVTVDQLSNCTHLSPPTDYLLMREELGIHRRDPIFERTLSTAARLAVSSASE